MTETKPSCLIVEEAKRDCVVNIGQLSEEQVRQLNAAFMRGELDRWRGFWYPDPRWPVGIGPLKTVWGMKGSAPKPA